MTKKKGRSFRRHFSRVNKRGSMLFFCLGSLCILLLLVGFFGSLYNLYFAHDRLDRWSESVAAASAQQLNCNDHIGKLNHLISHSREFVYVARQQLQMTIDDQEEFGELTPLASQVLGQARCGALVVGQERDRLAAVTVASVQDIVTEANVHGRAPVEIFSISTNQFAINEVQLGCLARCDSNVEPSSATEQLTEYDFSRQYINKQANLYRASIDLTLPAPDQDLHFRLAALPAAVEGTVEPLHLIDPQNFKSLLVLDRGSFSSHSRANPIGAKTDVMPSAVRLVGTAHVQANVLGNLEAIENSANAASSMGACPEAR